MNQEGPRLSHGTNFCNNNNKNNNNSKSEGNVSKRYRQHLQKYFLQPCETHSKFFLAPETHKS